jgi:hypothetical protein
MSIELATGDCGESISDKIRAGHSGVRGPSNAHIKPFFPLL